jgi:hypothetical protein
MNLSHREQFFHLTAGVAALPAVSRIAAAPRRAGEERDCPLDAIIKAARIKAGKARGAGVSTIFEQAPRLHIPQEEHDESA